MNSRIPTLAAAALLLLGPVVIELGVNRAGASAPPTTFAIATVHFETNATDGDFEVVFEIKGRTEGLNHLTITAPNGKVVADYSARDASTLGLRQFRFESPEPKDVASLKAAYPEGVYVISGTQASGGKLESKATLSHALPAKAEFLKPAPGAAAVPTKGVVLTWKAVPNVAAYNVYVEEDGGTSVTARLPGSATSFVVPNGYLAPGVEYVMGIGTISRAGNTSVVEASFTTAK